MNLTDLNLLFFHHVLSVHRICTKLVGKPVVNLVPKIQNQFQEAQVLLRVYTQVVQPDPMVQTVRHVHSVFLANTRLLQIDHYARIALGIHIL